MTSPRAAANRTRIKICGLTREADVDAAVDAGADAIGFVLYPKSPRAVTPERAAELASRLPMASLARVRGAIAQFHGEETPEQCEESTGPERFRYMRAARIPLGAAGAAFDLVKYASDYSHAQAILLDAHVEGYGGGGKAFDWSLLPPAVDAHLVLSGGLTPANVSDGIRILRTRCKTLSVDVSSGVEIDGPGNKGLKDAGKIRQFVAAVRAADASFSS